MPGTFRRLVNFEHLDELDAEHWIAAWEREAASLDLERHSSQFWDEADRWIAEQRSAQPIAQDGLHGVLDGC